MIFSMDLNASPLPEEDEEENILEHVEEVTEEERTETAVETLRRVPILLLLLYLCFVFKCDYSLFYKKLWTLFL